MGARIGETDIVLRSDDETLSEDSIADGVAVEGKDSETFIGLLESVDVVVWGAGCGIGGGVVIIVGVVLDGVSETFIVGKEILGGGVAVEGKDSETFIGLLDNGGGVVIIVGVVLNGVSVTFIVCKNILGGGVSVVIKDSETLIGLLASVVVVGAGCGIGVGVVIIVDGVSEIFIVGEEILGGGVVGKDGGDDETLIGFGAITGCGKGLYWSPYIA